MPIFPNNLCHLHSSCFCTGHWALASAESTCIIHEGMQQFAHCMQHQQVVLYAVDRSVGSGGKRADLKSRHSCSTSDQLAVIPFSYSCLMSCCFVIVWSKSCWSLRYRLGFFMHAQMHRSTNCKHASDMMTCHNARTQLYQDCIYRTLMLQRSLAHCKQHRAMHGQSQTRQRYII